MNREIISRYIGQPESLPHDLRAALARAWNGQPVQLYALADLDHTLKLEQQWLALGASHVAVARLGSNGTWEIESVDRARIRVDYAGETQASSELWRDRRVDIRVAK